MKHICPICKEEIKKGDAVLSETFHDETEKFHFVCYIGIVKKPSKNAKKSNKNAKYDE
jgi:hypothetical protein